VAITGGGLTLANPSVRVLSENPTQLEVSTSVTDARGTGAGWFLSLAAAAPSDSGPQTLIITGAQSACESGSACTLPDNDIPYPLPVSVNGARSWAFEAGPSSGLGAQTVHVFVTVPPGVRDPLNLGFSVSTQPPGASEAKPTPGPTSTSAPAPSAGLGPQLPPCSVREMTTTDTCQTAP
jgi:hypothetical protein